MKPKILAVTKHSVSVDTMLMLIRMVAGMSFAFYGSFKIAHPLNWMGPDSAFPAFFQLLAAISEFCGGIAWVIGFLTPIASFAIFCTMAVATHMHLIVNGDPFVSFTGGGSYDHALLFLVISLVLLVLGPGRFSIDRLVFGKK
jgi:putative oxidoreductase